MHTLTASDNNTPRLYAFDCIALLHKNPPQRIGILAYNKTAALITAHELFPEHTVAVVELAPDW